MSDSGSRERSSGGGQSAVVVSMPAILARSKRKRVSSTERASNATSRLPLQPIPVDHVCPTAMEEDSLLDTSQSGGSVSSSSPLTCVGSWLPSSGESVGEDTSSSCGSSMSLSPGVRQPQAMSPPPTPADSQHPAARESGCFTTPRSRWRRRLTAVRRLSHPGGMQSQHSPVSSAAEDGSGLQRVPPLPYLPWAETQQMWLSMRRKDTVYVRSSDPLLHHQALKSHMRSVLIDWLIEVCEVHLLHRETFYLGVDFLDRYLSRTKDLPKSQLQLTGITCLMIAAKLEEIYPPKLSDFAYVTDGACTEEDIVDKELVIMKVLRWEVAPVTPQHWLSTYLQLADMPRYSHDTPISAEKFVVRRFSSLQFVQMCQLLDLCSMDPGWPRHKYGVLAAAAFYHFTADHSTTVELSGYSWLELAECVEWMAPFFTALHHHQLNHVPHFEKVSSSDFHNIQVHAVNLNILEEAQQCCVQAESAAFSSPQPNTGFTENGELVSGPAGSNCGRDRPGFLTPPDSGRRGRLR